MIEKYCYLTIWREEKMNIAAKRMENVNVQNNVGDEIRQEKIEKCPECSSKHLIKDYRKAELYCADCGLVIMENIVDLGPEWRAFDKDQWSRRARAGAPMTYRIHDKGLSSNIQFPWHGTSAKQGQRLNNAQRRALINRQEEKSLIFALGEIDRMASALRLPVDIRETASMLYQEAMKQKLIRGRSIESVTTALLYIACKQYGVPRTLKEVKEISRVRQQKEITRAYFHLLRNLDLKVSPASPVDLVPRFCSLLNLDGEIQSKAKEIIQKAKEANLTNGPGPTGTAAAAIYIAAISSGEHRTQKEVSDATGTTEVTIRNRYKEIAELLEIDALLCSDGRVGKGLKRILDKN